MTCRRVRCVSSDDCSQMVELVFGRGLMQLFDCWIQADGTTSLLYWRICHELEVAQAGLDSTSLLFACAIHCASRVFRSYGPSQRTAVNAARATLSSRAAATRRADRFVRRRPRCANSRGVNVSNRDCRSGSLDAESCQPQG